MPRHPHQTWGGRFAAGPAAAATQFTESVSFDWRLYRQDIAGSIAHAAGLARAGIISRPEARRIARGLRAIQRDIEHRRFRWDPALEDVHMNIEAALVRKIGGLGQKLHTARSRNDQVATDLRLWLRDEIADCGLRIADLQQALVALASKNVDVVMPGYTHLQRAQPVLVAHHLLAYVEMLDRDQGRLGDCQKRLNVCPLGSGALAGSTLRIDRTAVARALGFDGVTLNSMDAVSDRDFVVEFEAAAALVGVHLSRLAEDLVLWSSAEFGFVTIADAYTTGSSLMPQKRNPDVAELVRGKSGRLIGNLVAVLTLLKGLPLTYNRDLQEDKQPLFDTVDALRDALPVFAAMLRHTRINPARCAAAAADPRLLATDLVDFLVKKGVAFRPAHQQVGRLVAEAELTGQPLPKLAAGKWGAAAARVFEPRRALAARRATGAPSPANVRAQLARWKRRLR
ncbi:argininosuccinate lyase [bacterium]|nr:argininosuccinate lyase [bacterium]